MVGHDDKLKLSATVALGAMFVMFVGAILLYRERLFADTSYIVFGIVNNKSLAIQNNRYGSFITQIVPYLGQKFGLSLRAIVFAYSISFNLFFLIVVALLIFRFRQYALSVILTLFYLLLVSESYFLENDELLQGVAWMFLGLATVFVCNERAQRIGLSLILYVLFSALALTSHFIVVISFVYLLIYAISDKDKWKLSTRQTIFVCCAPVAILVIKLLVTHSGYDDLRLHNATHFSIQDIIDSFSKPVVLVFLERCLSNYWFGVILFISSAIVMINNKQMIRFAWTVLFITGYIVLMGLTYRDEGRDTVLAHIELEWQSLGIIIATPFVFEVLTRLDKYRAALILTVILVTRLTYIGIAVPKFIWRTQFSEIVLSRMRKKKINKLILYSDDRYRTKYVLDWTIPYESLFASDARSDRPMLTYCILNKNGDKEKIDLLTSRRDVYYQLFYCLPVGEVNSPYFVIDTMQPYSAMSFDDFFR